MGRNIEKYMKEKILNIAKRDIPLYLEDFKTFWDKSLDEISDDDLHDSYKSTLAFKNWKIAIHSLNIKDYDLIINEIFEDVNSSFFLALLGLYRSAHMHMRSSIELSLQFLFFIHHPIEYERWKNGDYVIKFDKLSEYLRKHPFFDTDVDNLLLIITQNWKYYSKHIHGESPIFFQCETDVRKTNAFSRRDFGIWKSNFNKNVYNLNKLFLLFFKKDFNRIPEASRKILISFLREDEKEIME